MTTAETMTFRTALEAKRQELTQRIRSNAAGLILEFGEGRTDRPDSGYGRSGRNRDHVE